MPSILLHLLAAALYAGLGLWFWRSCNRDSTRGGVPVRRCMGTRERVLLLLALLAHGLAMHNAMFEGDGMRFGFGLAISLMLWLAVAFYWIETFYARLEGLHMVVLPAGFAGSVIPLLFPAQHLLVNATSTAFRVHFIVAMLAYSLFTLAALHAMLMAVAERQLHSARLSRSIAALPPLMTMEALLFRLIGMGFILLSITLVSGIFFSEELFDKAFRLDHKTLFAIISWLLFGALLFGRTVWGWRGRMALRWTLAGFSTLLLAYLGSRFVVEVLLHRMI